MLGGVSVSRRTLSKQLERGHSVCVIVGGEQAHAEREGWRERGIGVGEGEGEGEGEGDWREVRG